MSDDVIRRKDAIKATWQEPTYTDPLNVLTEVRDRIEAIPSADRPQGWIPCSERLPDLNENGVSDMVLLCWSDGQMTVGAYQGDRTFVGQAWPTARDCRVTVTAWQSLPEPWKGADDE